MSRLISGWNKFKKVKYFSQVFLAPTGAIFRETNNETTNTVMSHIQQYKELEGEQMGGEFTEE